MLDINLVRVDHLLKYNHVQIKFPRTKNKRIRKKWSKNMRNFKRVHEPQVYKMGRHVFADPVSYFKILDAASRVPASSLFSPPDPKGGLL